MLECLFVLLCASGQKINVQVTSLLASAQGWPTLHTYSETMEQFVGTLADMNGANDLIASASGGTTGPSTQASVRTTA